MHLRLTEVAIAASLVLSACSTAQTNSGAQVAPAGSSPTWATADGTVVLPNFRFGTGETLPQLRLHYLTLGTPHHDAAGRTDNAVLLLHGTGGNAHSLMNPLFSNVLFGPGAPLDITRYFLILPDDIGHGQSSPPTTTTTWCAASVSCWMK